MNERPYYIQIRNQEQEVVIADLQINDNLILEPDGRVVLVIRYI